MSDRVQVGSLDALIEFRNHLKHFNGNLEEGFRTMRSHLHELGDVWQDDKYKELDDALSEVGKGIERYLAVTDSHEAHLLRLIERLRVFLDTRLS